MSGEGQKQLDNLSAAGFNTDEVNNWQMQKRQELGNAGFNDAEVNDYFGQKPFNDAAVKTAIDKTLAPAIAEAKGDGTTEPKPFTFSDAVKAGWQQSDSALMYRGKLPDITLPENASTFQKIAAGTAGIVGDLPFILAGSVGGAAAGGSIGAGATAETGPGAIGGGTVGAAMGAGAGGMAFPTLLRSTMMDAYKNGEVKSASDFMSRAGGIFLDTTKDAITGALTMGAGKFAKPALVARGAGPVLTNLGTASAEAATMVGVHNGLNGKLPEPEDFVNAALMIGAFKTVPYVAGKVGDAVDAVKQHAPNIADGLRNIYSKTGVPPSDVAQDIQRDPTIAQDLISNPKEVPSAYKDQIDPVYADKNPYPGYREIGKDEILQPGADVKMDMSTGKNYLKEEPVAPEVPEPGSLAEAQQNILDKIQVGGKDAPADRSWDSFYTKVLDDMHPLQKYVEDLTGEKADREGTNPYILARLTRGSYGKADQFLTQSPFEFDTYKNVGKSLEDIIAPFRDDMDGVRAFAVAKRAQELEGRGINSGFDLESANKVVDGAGDKYAGVVKELNDYQNHLTDYLHDAGVLSDDAHAAMREANKNYVPFYRVFETNERTTSGGAGKGIQTKDPLKAIKGSDRAVIDPIESIIKNTYTYLALADRNEVGQSLVKLAGDAGKIGDMSDGALMEKVPTPIKGITVQDKEMTKFLQDNGIKEVPDDLLTVFRAARQPLADDEIAVFNDGKREVYRLPSDVAAVFKAADKESANWLFRIITAPTKMFRAGVTLSPDFFPRNIIRDQFDATINSRNGFIPFLDTVQGAASMIKQDDVYQNWLKSGGANATMVTLDRDYIQNNVMKLNEETGFADKAWNVIKSPFDALRVVSELAENATRIGEFKKAAGEDPTKADIQNAGFQSREVTLDFARIGSKTQSLNMLVAFWNAQVQGIDRIGRRFAEDPLGTSAKIGASITLPSMLLWWANHDDPRYNDIPDWQKDMFWIVMTKDTIYRIPKPHEAGILFGSGIERFMDYLKGSNPKALQDYTADVAQSFAPGYVPTVAQPVIEQFANKSLFTGGKIVPSSTEGLLPEVQYQPYTTELAKTLGKLVGQLPTFNKPGTVASASIMENYIRQWSGGLGMYAVQAADAGLRKAGVLPDPVMPVSTLADIPFIKAFVVRYPSAGAQPIQDFYDKYESKLQVINTMKYLDKNGDVAAGIHLAQMNPDAIAGQLTGIKQALANQQKFIQLVYKNPMTDKDPATLSADERQKIGEQKRQLIESAYYQMINTARMGNQIMRNVDVSMNK